MSNIQEKLDSFKKIVIENCENDGFEYREWFVKDHLAVVERIAMELCELHPEADRDLVFTLVWLHDFGKPLDIRDEYETTKTKGAEALRSVGLEEEFIEKVMEAWMTMEKKVEKDMAKEPIEVRIISSADGASHFVGKFYATYFSDSADEAFTITEKRIRGKNNQGLGKENRAARGEKGFRKQIPSCAGNRRRISGEVYCIKELIKGVSYLLCYVTSSRGGHGAT